MPACVYALYFSPTHSSRKITRTVAASLADKLALPVREWDLTLPAGREQPLCLEKEDVLVCGFPVYGGRVPLPMAQWFSKLTAPGAAAVIAAVYGNRDYDDALLEARELLAGQGLWTAAAGAFIAEHSYTSRVGTGRPDREDMAAAARYGAACGNKLLAHRTDSPALPGNIPYKERKSGDPFRPLTAESCSGCGLCAAVCPMGIIHRGAPALVDDGCLGCMACVKACPLSSKSFDSPRIRQVTAMLEANCLTPKKPEWFL